MSESLRFAVDVWEDPRSFAHPGYGVGPDAYDNWLGGIAAGCGTSHGAWWIGTVWSECRDAAKEYVREVARQFPDTADLAHELSGRYGRIAEILHAAADRTLESQPKMELLREARMLEAACIPELSAIADLLEVTQEQA